MNEVDLGRLLQAARKKAGLTQQELCQKAGLSYSTLAKIERGAIKAPSIFTIQSIAGALNTSLTDLIGDATVQKSPKKRSKNGVRFVYFDINGCLVRFFHPAFNQLSQDTGIAADVIETSFWDLNDVACRGEMTMSEFNEAFATRLGIEQVDWQNYYFEALDVVEEMQSLLTWAAQHYHVGLLSNIMPGFITRMIKEGALPRVVYDQIIDSSVVGAIKPEDTIFEIAETKSGVKPEEILFIDDSRSNVMAAQKRGWKVIWFDGYRSAEIADRIRVSLEPEQPSVN